ncbi:UNVERIFIED_CONTAM: hypothetical protein Slati_1365000 [Sesamum latifolium]|uniref:Uncharacterized protein n=1 Tax=Sesamum latifolium TaxID=2727402 RepID=A0AAW2XL78_9LAMI
MTYFKDISSSSRVQHLVILDDEKQSEDKGTTLTTHAPLIGRYTKQLPRLENPLYTEQWSREVPLSKTSQVWSLQAIHHRLSNGQIPLSTLDRHHRRESQVRRHYSICQLVLKTSSSASSS